MDFKITTLSLSILSAISTFSSAAIVNLTSSTNSTYNNVENTYYETIDNRNVVFTNVHYVTTDEHGTVIVDAVSTANLGGQGQNTNIQNQSHVTINTTATNLTVSGNSTVLVTTEGMNSWGNNHGPQHTINTPTISNSVYDNSHEVLDGTYIAGGSTTVIGSNIPTSTGSIFKNGSRQTVGTRSLSEYAEFHDTSSQAINGGTSNGAIFNNSANQTINSGTSNGSIFNNSADQTINGGTSNGSIFNNSADQTINGGLSNGSIFNDSADQTVNGGISDAAVFNDRANQTINGGTSNGAIFNNSANQINNGGISNGAMFNDNTSQTIKNNGISNDEILNHDAKQTIENGGISNNAIFNQNASQVIGNGGVSNNAQFHDTSVQYVKNGGTSNNATFYDGSTYVVESGGITNNTVLKGKGTEFLMGSNATGETTLEGSENNKGIIKIHAGDVNNADAAKNGATVDNFIFDNASDHANHHENSEVQIIARATSADATDRENSQVNFGSFKGKGRVIFQTDEDRLSYSKMNIGTLGEEGINQENTYATFHFNQDILGGESDFIKITDGYGTHGLHILDKDTGKEVIRVRPQSVDFAEVGNSNNSNAQFEIKDVNDNTLDKGIDAGAYVHVISSRPSSDESNTIWSFGASEQLTPAARAVLGMSSAPQLMFNNELDNLRSRLVQVRDAEKVSSGVWAHAIGNQTKVDRDQVQYKLNHAGVEMGVDKAIDFNNGKLIIGGFTGFDNADVKHEQGGTSKVDSYTFGAYATYLTNTGWYVDGVLKYNHFKNKLRTTSTNGYDVRSHDYNTSAFGASVETGYTFKFSGGAWVTPYGQLSYNSIGSKDITLNNEMTAKLNSQKSLTSELGATVGQDFKLNNQAVFSPYFKAAWVHQFKDNNAVDINDFHHLTTDLSGSSAKFGLGFNAMFNKNFTMYMEVDTRTGNRVKSPINGQLGLRYNF